MRDLHSRSEDSSGASNPLLMDDPHLIERISERAMSPLRVLEIANLIKLEYLFRVCRRCLCFKPGYRASVTELQQFAEAEARYFEGFSGLYLPIVFFGFLRIR